MTKLNTLSKLVLVFGLATATLGASSVMAKGDGHRQGNSPARFLLSERGADKLELTDEQQTKLKAIFEAQKTQMQALRGTDKEARKAQRTANKAKMDALLSAATFDENAAKELLTQRHEKGEEMGLIKLKTQHQVWQVLNTEQREKFEKMQKRMGKKHSKQKS
ncbi:Spy/CpxP family protein refolding chaperone [Pseudoalteromonas sp. SWXJZ94C]|uniref:Spy/CpxP family protein refolding chaperone n=1 Tax=Pseudoalteromonas sp. SWXJZ94C TaxID=2792065 RepID=UPI0018CCDDED|nr:Spy/CpxP family protein refolding chaperone [Pseudoalteromonas sp. SWXJZ94C]MBH0056262.1 Spy/CpxP family protein refolding chaperone [Pseudoalteromonas sp. SWXJZ94C]